MREIIKEARNVDEAIEQACQALGVERDAAEFEIISLPKRGFLGLRNTPAKVRVYIEEPESPAPRPAAPPKSVQKAAPEPPKAARQEPARPAPRRELKPEPRPETKPEPRVEARPKPENKPEPRPEVPKKPFEPLTPASELKFVSADTVDGKAKTASDYVKGVLAEMGVSADISVAFTESGIVLRLSGAGLGVIIGRRGETLDSLQYLAGLVANRQEGDYIRVTIDSGNYREKRERTLEQLAQKLSASAIRYGRASTLEPMNPYERRIIHATVSRIEGVSSTSIGEEPNRRVVITPDNVKPQNRVPRPVGGGGTGGRGPRPPRRDDRPFGERPAGDRPFTDRPAGDHPAGDRPFADRPAGERPAGDRPFSNDRPFNDRPPRRDNRDRPPFKREGGRDRPPFNREPRTDHVKPTSTEVDRAYARELEKEPQTGRKPEGADKTGTQAAPAREAHKEGVDLPLYGKIEL